MAYRPLGSVWKCLYSKSIWKVTGHFPTTLGDNNEENICVRVCKGKNPYFKESAVMTWGINDGDPSWELVSAETTLSQNFSDKEFEEMFI